MTKITRCNRCVMDNLSDKTIYFDSEGYCNYCTKALLEKDKTYFPNDLGKIKINNILSEVKK